MMKSKAYCVSVAGLLFYKGLLATTNQAGQTTLLSHKISAHLYGLLEDQSLNDSVSLWRQFSNMNSVLHSLTQRKQHHREARDRCQFLAEASVPSSLEKNLLARIMRQNGFCQCVVGGGPTHHREIDQSIFQAFKEGGIILLPKFLLSVTKVQAPYFSPSRCNQHPQLVTGPDRCTTLLTEN